MSYIREDADTADAGTEFTNCRFYDMMKMIQT